MKQNIVKHIERAKFTLKSFFTFYNKYNLNGLKAWDDINFWTYGIWNKSMEIQSAEDLSIHLFLQCHTLHSLCRDGLPNKL